MGGRSGRPQPALLSPRREANSAATVSNMISFICSVSPLNHRCPNDLRPHVQVLLNGIPVDFLIDTGASLSVISEEIYSSIELSSLKSVPVEPGLKLSAASGHLIEIVGRYRFHLTLLGFNLERSIYVVKGLVKSSAILGFDFIRKTELVVSGRNIFFQDFNKEDCAALAVLHAPGRMSTVSYTHLTLPTIYSV